MNPESGRMAWETSSPRNFRWQVDGAVATLMFCRPGRKNALTFDAYAELRDLFRSLCDETAIKAVVLTGSDGNFCSGGDVHEIIGPLTRMDPDALRAFTHMTGHVVKAMRACPQPIIAAVDGICVGAGAAIALASDIRMGTPACRTAFLFSRVGLAGCDMGACALLPRVIGHGRASELLYTGRFMQGDEAERWGFFNRLCTPDQLLNEALAMAHDLASGPTVAHAMTKKMLHQEWSMALDQAIDAEADAQALCMQTDDFQRAYRAFIAHEPPRFAGN